MKPQELWKKIFVDLLLGLLFVSLASGTSFSLPEVENVESGQAQIQYPDAATLNINASDKAIINYKSFDIKENESVMINLPAVDNEILNRVLGDQASSILGKLTCNGIFIIVNKNGIYFGPGANVDVAGLIASTRDITNSDFLDSKHIFG
jgi:filamentous hemagglutinin family protein